MVRGFYQRPRKVAITNRCDLQAHIANGHFSWQSRTNKSENESVICGRPVFANPKSQCFLGHLCTQLAQFLMEKPKKEFEATKLSRKKSLLLEVRLQITAFPGLQNRNVFVMLSAISHRLNILKLIFNASQIHHFIHVLASCLRLGTC